MTERLKLGLALLSIALGVAVGLGGCATVRQTPTGREVVLQEVKGGVIAGAMSGATGTNTDAITLPTKPPTTVILRNADDPGLRCHEAKHRDQILQLGRLRFIQRYGGELVAVGYWAAPLEVEAREAQAKCDAGGSP